MLSFINRIRAGKSWVTSLSLASNENYEEAYNTLINGLSLGLSGLEVELFKIFLCIATGRMVEANTNILKFISDVSNTKEYNHDEVLYMRKYASWCSNFLPEGYESKRIVIINEDDTVKLNNVRKPILENFPLSNN